MAARAETIRFGAILPLTGPGATTGNKHLRGIQFAVEKIDAGTQAAKLATASPYPVNTLPMFGDEIRVLSQYLTAQGKRQGTILFEHDAAGITGCDGLEKLFPSAGGTMLAQEPAQFGQTDHRPALLDLAQQ